jgi:hypothetical protein
LIPRGVVAVAAVAVEVAEALGSLRLQLERGLDRI